MRAYVSGFGRTGPYVDQPVLDGVVQALAGMAETHGREGAPTLATTYVVDKLTATMAVQAILDALVARSKTGLGDSVDVAMIDSAAYCNFCDGLANRTFLDEPSGPSRNRLAAAARPTERPNGDLAPIRH